MHESRARRTGRPVFAPAAKGGRRPAIEPRAGEEARRSLGQLGEDLAATHLRRRGFEILDRNVRTAAGEIDLIATDGARLVFVEVKCRRRRGRDPTQTSTWALEAIGPGKQARLRRLAGEWLSRSVVGRPFAEEIRFDAIAIAIGPDGRMVQLDHLEAAW